MSTHTPGPWKIGKILEEGLYNKAIFIHPDIGYVRDNKEEAMTNAHLIAAAPEMFELLKLYSKVKAHPFKEMFLQLNFDSLVKEVIQKIEGRAYEKRV